MKTIPAQRVFKGASWLPLGGGLLTGCATGTYQPAVRFGQLNLETRIPRQDLVILDTVEGT